ncbi:NADH dehydrogenase [ubiquinone] 1 alpha subcomplex assembly factor 4-like isoform X3 [Penaeus monodon]|uniref:NADH dehydrogenase [ubiquinone] 1 alpha subcomplex assembly factor 4-like isoform X3 n=1 Tax=Penaeus monodon TaxID=6687 RepID=UPI0018A757CD|nr:NADH dehydrogenase [ubiquinone] 1 alpha subcomplex assembly factor 4-like isoform X3 [Penaeus monodon]
MSPRWRRRRSTTTKFRKMGKVMSALGRRATKPIRDFNVESRAHREITKEKRPVAPRHESTRLIIEESIRNQPEEVKKSLEEKDDILLNRLKQIYVTSEDPMPTKEIPDNPERSLPSDRSYVADPEYGFYEPKVSNCFITCPVHCQIHIFGHWLY